MRTPSILELRFFETAIRTGSLSAAARELGVSQQAVSARVRELERVLSLSLAKRSPAGISATDEGLKILAGASEVLTAARRLDETAASLRHDTSGRTLRIGASQTISAHLLPGWLLKLRLAREGAGIQLEELTLRTDNSTRIVSQVRDGELDLGFIETPLLPKGLGCATVGTDQLIIAVDMHHPWTSLKSLSPQDLAHTPLVTREAGSGTREAFESFMRELLQLELPEPLLALGTEAAVRSAVMQGVGPAVLSELTVHDDVRLGRIHAVSIDPPIVRPLTAVWRGTQRDLSGSYRQLVALAAGSEHIEHA